MPTPTTALAGVPPSGYREPRTRSVPGTRNAGGDAKECIMVVPRGNTPVKVVEAAREGTS